MTPEAFQALVDADGFIEHATFAGRSYGTSVAAVKELAKQGRVCILDIEMEGVKQVKKTDLAAKFVFVKPPSIDELERRLRSRGSEKEEAIQARLRQSIAELAYADTDAHDRVIVNDDIETAYSQLEEYIMAQVRS